MKLFSKVRTLVAGALAEFMRLRTEKIAAQYSTARPGQVARWGMLAASVIAACVIVPGTLPAQAAASRATAAARFAAAATPEQNEALDAILAHIPGGARVSASEAEWDRGRIIAGVSASSHAGALAGFPAATGTLSGASGNSQTLTCSSAFLCAWGETNDGGSCWMFVQGGTIVVHQGRVFGRLVQ
jgi:hypothetical protein